MSYPYKARDSNDFSRDTKALLEVVDATLEVYPSDKLLTPPCPAPTSRRRDRASSFRHVERATCAVVAFVFFLFVVSHRRDHVEWQRLVSTLYRVRSPAAVVPSRNEILNYDKPQATLRANLREDLMYLTTFPYAGLTNQLLSAFKLVYLAKRLGREAILPDLEPNHDEGDYGRFSEFFDLGYWSKQTSVGIAEWRDVKTLNTSRSTVHEQIGCWGDGGNEAPVVRYDVETRFWPVPSELRTKFGIEPTLTYSGVEVIDSDNKTVTAWLDSKVRQWFGSTEVAPRLPDRHLLCFQNLFYASEQNLTSLKWVEGEKGSSVEVEGLATRDDPVWDQVGRHLRFGPRVERIVDDVLTRLVGDAHSPFVAIHLRQGDFTSLGRATNSTSEIKAKFTRALDDVRVKVNHIRGTLAAVEDADELPVVLATDSTDPSLLLELTRLGWILIDHDKLETRERYGGWYPGVLDSAILSRAVGLVGTKRSTFSYLAERRIESWNGGASIIVEL
ncbi:hypothetical protein JCM3766R1_005577 [Sporobolomyces carnicolor]